MSSSNNLESVSGHMLHLQSISQKPWNSTQLYAPNKTAYGIWLGVVHIWELKPDGLESSYYAKNFMYFNWNFTLIWGNRRLALQSLVSPKEFYRSMIGHSHFTWIKNAKTKLSWNLGIFFHRVKCYQSPMDSVTRLQSLPQDQWLHKCRQWHDERSIFRTTASHYSIKREKKR